LGPTATLTGSICAAAWTSGACSTKSRGVRTTSFPTQPTSSTPSCAPPTRCRTVRTVLFFGLLSYAPNVDGVIHFVQDIWPRIAEAHPEARCKIIGGQPPPSLLELAGARVELTGFVEACGGTLRPRRLWWFLAGGRRHPAQDCQSMAMGKAIVSTTLGAEGIEAVPRG
jgi:hypothetical protein